VLLPGETISVTVMNSDLRKSVDYLNVNVQKKPSADAEREVVRLEQTKHQGTIAMIIDAYQFELEGAALSNVSNRYVDGLIQFGGPLGQVCFTHASF